MKALRIVIRASNLDACRQAAEEFGFTLVVEAKAGDEYTAQSHYLGSITYTLGDDDVAIRLEYSSRDLTTYWQRVNQLDPPAPPKTLAAPIWRRRKRAAW